ncbi:MAG: hypothetical protein ACRDGS_09280, partial [Chloroflexota bacterium]
MLYTGAGEYVHGPTEDCRQFPAQAHEREARRLSGREIHQHVHVALIVEIRARCRAEKRKFRHAPFPAETIERIPLLIADLKHYPPPGDGMPPSPVYRTASRSFRNDTGRDESRKKALQMIGNNWQTGQLDGVGGTTPR